MKKKRRNGTFTYRAQSAEKVLTRCSGCAWNNCTECGVNWCSRIACEVRDGEGDKYRLTDGGG